MFRKFCNLFAIVFLSVLVIYMAGGATVKQCACSGRISVVNVFKQASAQGYAHKPSVNQQPAGSQLASNPCMRIYSESIDASTPSQVQAYDFTPMCVDVLQHPALTPYYNISGKNGKEAFLADKIPIPPRLFLSLKHSLLI